MSKPQKFDTYKEFAADYASPKDPVLLRLKPARYLAIAGRGEPRGKAFQAAIRRRQDCEPSCGGHYNEWGAPLRQPVPFAGCGSGDPTLRWEQ